jgi:hypothetical protein
MHILEWVFSGIGVFILAAVIEWRRRAKPRAQIRTAESPKIDRSSAVLQKTAKGRITDWISLTARIRKGDYYDAAQSLVGPLRVEIVDIRSAPIPAKFGQDNKTELVAELNITAGGGVVYPGNRAVWVGVNRFLLPRVTFELSTECAYAFHVRGEYFSALCISITHINSADNSADVHIARISVEAF